MAEGVQFQLERQVEELEQMVHCGLFTKQETAAIVKKRKQHEYKVHRHTKSKEDYLNYIQYESALLALLRKRRETKGYAFRKKEIDHAILTRIHSLFRAVLKRFQSDVSLWLTYIEFCKEKRNDAMVSRTYSDLLAIHNHDPSLWVLAAQWEMETNKDAETSRSLLQRGLRFIPESIVLWKEYFRMELIHMERMRERMMVLNGGTFGEEQEMEIENDAVLSGKIAEVVYCQAVNQFPENENLVFALLEVATNFSSVLPTLEALMLQDLRSKFDTKPKTWDVLARHKLRVNDVLTTDVPGGDDAEDVERRRVAKIELNENSAMDEFENGIKFTSSHPESWILAISFAVECIEKGDGEPSLTLNRLKRINSLMMRCQKEEKLTEDLYLKWIRVVRNYREEDMKDEDCLSAESVIKSGLALFPANVTMWSIELQKQINESGFSNLESSKHKTIIKSLLNEATSKVDEKEIWFLWEIYLDWYGQLETDKEAIKDAFKLACLYTGRESSMKAKEAFLCHSLKSGTNEMMETYNWLKLHKPHSRNYFRMVLDALGDDSSLKEMIFSEALEELGEDWVDLWLEFETFQIKNGKLDSALIYKKALRKLNSNLIPTYETKHTLNQTGNLK